MADTDKRRLPRDLLSFAAVAAVVLSARSSIADHYRVPSGSMEPTVEVGDRVLVDKAAYGLRVPWTRLRLTPLENPARGDVVVLTSPEDSSVLLKRVVAIESDRVEVRDGVLWLNGERRLVAGPEPRERLDDGEHALGLDHGGGPDFGPTEVPKDHVLVLGDNRGNSRDGRSFGFVPCEAVLGRALAVYYRDGFAWLEL